MNEEERFDELLSSKLSERDFPFDELNWDEAERLIIRQQRRRKAISLAGIFVLGLTVGMLIMLPLVTSTHSALPNNTLVTTSSNKQNNVAQNTVLPATANSSEVNTSNTNTNGKERKAPLPVHSAFVKKDIRTGIRGSSSNRLSPIVKTNERHQLVAIASVDKNKQQLSASPILLATAGKADKSPEHKEAIKQNGTSPASSQPATSSITENKTPAISVEKTEKGATENTSVTGNSNTTVVTSNKQVAKKDSENITALPLLRDAATAHTPDDYSPNIFSVYAGGDYSFGWDDNGDKEANGITPWAGIDYARYFSSKVSASLGAGFSELSGLNRTYTVSSVGYDFGAKANITTITPQTIYYLVFPLKIQYSLNTKNVFSLGYNYLLMLTTSSMVTNYQETYFLQTAGTSKKGYGYTEGFASNDMQFAFSYTRMLTGRLGISAEFYLGFNSVENSSFPSNSEETVERQPIYTKNNGFRLVLSYQLIK